MHNYQFLPDNSGPQVLEKALLIYRAPKQKDSCFITVHDIKYQHMPPAPVICEGRLLDPKNQKELLALLSFRKTTPFRVIPKKVLAYDDSRLCWYVKPAHRRILFSIAEGDETDLSAPWPGLVFDACAGQSLRIAAVKNETSPDENTPLYHAPLLNLDYDGDMCFGNIRIPDTACFDTLPLWERAVFDTWFTEIRHEHVISEEVAPFDEDDPLDEKRVLAFWMELSQNSLSKFPEDALVPMGMTLKEWIAS